MKKYMKHANECMSNYNYRKCTIIKYEKVVVAAGTEEEVEEED